MTTTDIDAAPGLYAGLLGAAWGALDPKIRRAHRADGVASGRLTIRYGTGPVADLLRRALRLPRAGDALETRLTITRDTRQERWARTIGGRSLVTMQRGLPDGRLAERVGVAELRFQLHVVEGALRYVPAGAALTLGRWSLPWPRWLAPRVEADEAPAAGAGAHVHVRISLPLIGFFMAYAGAVEPESVP